MSIRPRLIVIGVLLAAISCGKQNSPPRDTTEPAKKLPPIRGEWKLVRDGPFEQRVHWGSGHASHTASSVRFRKLDAHPRPEQGNSSYTFRYWFIDDHTLGITRGLTFHDDGTRNDSLEGLTPDQKLTFRIDGDRLTLRDEQGGEETYERQPVKSQEVTITELPLYADSCAEAVRRALAEVDGASDIKIDRPARTARLTIADEADWDQVGEALYRAGMHGKVDNASSARSPMRMLLIQGKPKEIRFSGVHACCEECRREIIRAVSADRATYHGEGPMRDVVFTGTDLSDRVLSEELQRAGFRAYLKP